MRRGGLFQVEAALKPALGFCAAAAFGVGVVFGAKLQQPLQLHLIEVQQQLAGLGLHRLAVDFHMNLAGIGVELQLDQRIFERG